MSRPASTCAKVLLPEPFGPIIACTSPAWTSKSTPCKISCSPTFTCRFFTLSILFFPLSSIGFRLPDLANAALQADAQQLLRLDRELHRQLADDLLSKAVHDHRDRVL